MNNKTKGAIAGIAGIALLAGGTTFALWNDDVNVDGGIITAGNLDVATVGTTQWVDTSADRTDKDHNIDLTEFKIVPGDTIQGTFGIAAALQGDNLVADLGLSLAGNAEGGLLADAKGVTVKYSLVNAATGVAVPGAKDIELGTPAKVAFAAADNTGNVAPSAVLPTLPAALPTAANLNVVVTATFDEDTDEQLRTKATADLQDLGVTLEQTRTATTGGGF
ncbi:alternate-type signal peptide domain-containing protein [Paeniglutamicibacter sp. NPDC091659]|uniref:alternate-type signal peptide domain-containing protein n=1 Tax=Paeniglutamicibacter sp. NPDC091659 TaxID=3364389 RepID=UPI0037FD2589